MLTYPQINPIALQIGPIAVRWYGLMYLIGFLSAWLLASKRADDTWSKDDIADLIFYGAIGVILGGRIGYVLFYNLSYYSQHLSEIFKVWDGGMSFHGGLIGVAVALWVFSLVKQKSYPMVTDFVVPLVPIGLGAGRLGNFINGELWGRVTTLPWGMIFPTGGPLPRHPSQLYEFLFEGIILFTILWLYSKKTRPPWAVSGLFLLCYGLFRFSLEFFRQPDPQLGFIAFGWMTQGQLLSLPMVVLGLSLLSYAYLSKNKKIGESNNETIS